MQNEQNKVLTTVCDGSHVSFFVHSEKCTLLKVGTCPVSFSGAQVPANGKHCLQTPVMLGLQQDRVTNRPQHVLLNLHLIPHPHTGLMLADKITSSLTQREIDESKFLMAVTDNGSNMIKAINSIQFSGRQVNPSVGANGANADEAELTDESAGNTEDR